MAIKAIKKAVKKYATEYARITAFSVVAALVVTAVIGAVGTPSRVSLLPQWLGLPVLVRLFVELFVVCFLLGILGRILKQNSGKLNSVFNEKLREPLTSRWIGLTRRTRAIILGTVVAICASSITAAVRIRYAIPLWGVGGVSLLAWPVGTYWALRHPSATESTGVTTSLSIRSQYAELRQLETRTIAVLVGFVIGTAIGSGLWLLGVGTELTGAAAWLVWLVATVSIYNRYATTLPERTELAIVETTTMGDRTELTIKNQGVETVDLTDATIKDTTHSRYRLGQTATLQPGRSVTICVSASFTLAPTTAERTLPLGYTLDRSQAAPIVYSQTGTAFELQHDAAPEDATWGKRSEYTSQSASVTGGAHSQD